jgi:hypothetical protein
MENTHEIKKFVFPLRHVQKTPLKRSRDGAWTDFGARSHFCDVTPFIDSFETTEMIKATRIGQFP